MNYNINKLLEKAESYTSRKVAKSWERDYSFLECIEYQIKYKGIEFSAIVSDNKIDDLFVLNIDISPRSNCLRLSPTDDLEVAYQEIISKIERIKKIDHKMALSRD